VAKRKKPTGQTSFDFDRADRPPKGEGEGLTEETRHCPKCGSTEQVLELFDHVNNNYKHDHYGVMNCGRCGTYIKFVAKPENQGKYKCETAQPDHPRLEPKPERPDPPNSTLELEPTQTVKHVRSNPTETMHLPLVKWECIGPYCRDRNKWWISIHGYIQCKNCHPPSFPHLVAEEGTMKDAPMVRLGYSCTPIDTELSEG
jgi:hypothetical protein